MGGHVLTESRQVGSSISEHRKHRARVDEKEQKARGERARERVFNKDDMKKPTLRLANKVIQVQEKSENNSEKV